MNKVDHHKSICKELNDTYRKKNAAYGDSFGETYRKLGIISAVTRITDKYNRLVTLATHADVSANDESLTDTLLDMANYCIMTVMEMETADAVGDGASVAERVDRMTKGVQT